MRPLLIGIVGAAAGAVGGWMWYAAHSPTPIQENAELAEAARDSATAVETNVALEPSATAATLATLPPQRIVLRLITYGPQVTLTGTDTTGTQTSLHDMFTAANIDIVTDVQPGRQYPFGSEYITEAELSSLASEPQSAGAGWKVTGVLLKRGTQPGDYGTIFPQPSRERFAVFAAEIGNSNKVVRTVAHELGHTLNLYHDDGDGACCVAARNGTSLMNQDRCLDQKAWRYTLSAHELDHLRNHPVMSVDPNGGVEFGFCTINHQRKC